VHASIAEGTLVIDWRYSENLHHRRTMERLAGRYRDELRALIDLSQRVTSVHTPSDFPLARVDQGQLDDLFSRL
jgi:non-ribosomal peptide synthase protein (TIGR01720 family)